MRKKCIGQITIDEYIKSIGARKTCSNKYFSGQVIYLVEKCDISKYEVHGIYYVEDEEAEVIVLIAREGAEEPFKYILLDEAKDVIFETKDAAENQALKALEECDCILASDMKVTDFKAFTSKDVNGRLLTAFYAVLDNGYIYMKDYESCGRLLSCSVKEAEEILRSGIEPYNSAASTLLPKLKNMYKTNQSLSGDWEYAERSSVFVA